MKHQRLLSYVRRAVDDYGMINENDKIAIGLSGGKDSVSLLLAMSTLRRFYPHKFNIEAITVSLGFEGSDFSPMKELCEKEGVNYTIVNTDIGDIIFNERKESNPCSLCAKMRRGALHELMSAHGIQKIALGHHFDDAVETFLLSLFYEGRIHCFMPVTYLDRTKITQIRPMLYLTERQIANAVRRLDLPVVTNVCPANGNTKRQQIKDLLFKLEKENPGVRDRLFGAIQHQPLEGWQKVNP